MFGIGRRNEMKSIERKSNSCVRDIENNLRDIMRNLNETIEISKESKLPENNILSQKEKVILDIKKGKEILEKYKGKIRIEGLNIARELALEDLKIGISECEEMVYSMKNMEIPQSEDIKDYFQEYSENYEVAMTGAKVAAGVGLAATGGAAVGSSLALAGITTSGIVGTSLLGVGSVLGGIGALAAGPVGWIVGGIGLLGFLGSAPSKEEIADARLELYKMENKRSQIYQKYMETKRVLGKAKGVIKLSKNFTDIRERLTFIFKLKREKMEKLIEDNLKENRIILEEEIKPDINSEINKVASYLYQNYKEKKKFFCFKRKKTIWGLIENSENIKESYSYINKYLRLPRKYKNPENKLSFILKEINLNEIEIIDNFNKKDSYEIFKDNLKEYSEEKINKNLRITSLEAKKKIKEVVDFTKLFKNIIITPMINLDATNLEVSEEVLQISQSKDLEYKENYIRNFLNSQEVKSLLEIFSLNSKFEEKDELNDQDLNLLNNKIKKLCPELVKNKKINEEDLDEILEEKGRLLENKISKIESFNLTEDQLEKLGFNELKKFIA